MNTEATEKVRSVMNTRNVYPHRLNREDGSFVQSVPGQIDSKGLDLCSHICADYCCHLTAQGTLEVTRM